MIYIMLIIGCVVGALWAMLQVTRGRAAVVLGGVAVGFVITAFFAITIIPSRQVGVQSLFGVIQDDVLTEGFNLKNPLVGVDKYLISRLSMEMSSEDGAKVITKDRTELDVDVSFPYQINGAMYPILMKKIGEAQLGILLRSSARSAVREAAAQFTWTEVAVTDKEEFVKVLQAEFLKSIVTDLAQNGISESDAQNAIVVVDPKLRKVLPPKRIRESIASRLAADEDLKKQKTLSLIAAEEANRRANEGEGVNKLFEKLPKGFTAPQIRDVLGAIADKTRADALLNAVEQEKVKVIVMNGQSGAISIQ